ncbi:MAG: two-component system regulatory protein YycI [Alicyclobacillus sp.]|nr:two-component system regulatory protein YycI [Alicyclobacillus sp.]
MNWELAKTWLIGIFLVLDVLLGLELWQSKQEMRGYVESYSDLLANTRTLLAEHGFELETTVPSNQPNMPSIHAAFLNVPLDQLAKLAFPRVKNVDINQITGNVTCRLGTLRMLGDGTWQVTYQHPMPIPANTSVDNLPFVWRANQYTPDTALSGNGVEVLVQHFNGFPLFDSQVQIQTGKSAIMGFTQSALTGLTPVGGTQPVISALDALNSLANAVDKSSDSTDNKILSIDLGYTRKISATSLGEPQVSANYWFPVWRVVTSNQVFYVNARSGEVEMETS